MLRGYPVRKKWLIALFGFMALFAGSTPVGAQATFKTLYEFQGGGDGGQPFTGLIFDASGALYGTTGGGGGSGCNGAGCGTVFKLTPPTISGGAWTKSVLYNFAGGSADGAFPAGALIFDASGALYGTTFGGGNASGCVATTFYNGCGTVFKLAPPTISGGTWTESVLYKFAGGSDSANPFFGGLIFDASGALYGTTYDGGGSTCVSQDPNFIGARGCGTVFKLIPSTTTGGAWTERVLYRFSGGSDDASPLNGLIFDSSGALYGTTSGNDAFALNGSNGTVFKLTPPTISGGAWTESVLYRFTGGSDGGFPQTGVTFDPSGALYGTTGFASGEGGGCGAVFRLAPPTFLGGAWTESTLYQFAGGSNGCSPIGNLIFNSSGALYGTTQSGGSSACQGIGCGTVFKLTPPATLGGAWTERVLHSFTGGSDGALPAADVIFDASGALYGTALMGGNAGCTVIFNGANGCGTVFKLSTERATSDFNDDGHSDILWQNTSGEVVIWEMNGTTVIGGGSLGNPGPTWHTIATGDFNGDGHADILWQNVSGEVYIWLMNGTNVIGGASLGNPGPSWHVIATGDFNGDGYADILWQNTNGEAYIWEMKGTGVIGGASLGNPGRSWHVIAAGDFNGDGYSDILWQNDSGEVYIWEMKGTSVIGGASLGNPGPTWHPIATGDFNGDGYADILWQNDSGEVYIWEMNGTSITGGGSLGNPGPSWHVIGSGDFNGDRHSDILWRNTNGEVYIWEMNGTSVTGGASLGNPGSSWHPIAK